MEETQKKFLSKVVDFFLKDTHIDHISEELFFNFLPVKSMRGPYSLRTPLSFLMGSFNRTCKNYFGLSDDEINYTWKSYKLILQYNIKKGIINESEDKQNKFLNKVVDFLVKDTEIDYKHQTIKFLESEKEYFTNFLFNTMRFLTYIPSYFSKYTKDTYGLSGDEIRYVWQQYRFIIRTKILSKSINESEDKQLKYLDKVLKSLVNDTKLDFENKEIFFHFSYHTSSFPMYSFFPIQPFDSFFFHTKYMYELTDEEVHYVWKKFIEVLSDKIYNKESINESDDKQKRYLDKVLEKLINDTIFDRNNNKIIFPFYRVLDVPINQPLSHTIFHPFIIYCSSIYALSNRESEMLWYKYEKVIQNWLYDDLSINESVKPYGDISDKGIKFLDKVVEFLYEDIKVEDFGKTVTFPFPYVRQTYDDGKVVSWNSLLKYCTDTYGLTERESEYVYRKINALVSRRLLSGKVYFKYSDK